MGLKTETWLADWNATPTECRQESPLDSSWVLDSPKAQVVKMVHCWAENLDLRRVQYQEETRDEHLVSMMPIWMGWQRVKSLDGLDLYRNGHNCFCSVLQLVQIVHKNRCYFHKLKLCRCQPYSVTIDKFGKQASYCSESETAKKIEPSDLPRKKVKELEQVMQTAFLMVGHSDEG